MIKNHELPTKIKGLGSASLVECTNRKVTKGTTLACSYKWGTSTKYMNRIYTPGPADAPARSDVVIVITLFCGARRNYVRTATVVVGRGGLGASP